MWDRWKRAFGRGAREDSGTGPKASPHNGTDLPDAAAEAGAVDDVRRALRGRIWAGFIDHAEALALASEVAEGEGVDPAVGQQVAEELWQARIDELALATGPSDYDRLRAAFATLAQEGFAAEMDFACCQNCGHAEIGDARRPGSHSYVFFHQQDSERLVDGEPLYLAFSFFNDHPDAPSAELRERAQAEPADPVAKAAYYDAYDELEARVGRRLVEVLRTSGLQVEWDGRNGSRPAVLIRDWRQPLVS